MSTRSVYDTPPDGDFARYVEELGHASAARVLQAGGVGGAVSPTPGRRPPRMPWSAATTATSNATTGATVGSAPAARAQVFAPVVQMLKLGLVVWIAYAVASAVFPPLAVIGWPLLVLSIVVAAMWLKALPWADLARTVRSEAEQKMRRPSPPP